MKCAILLSLENNFYPEKLTQGPWWEACGEEMGREEQEERLGHLQSPHLPGHGSVAAMLQDLSTLPTHLR